MFKFLCGLFKKRGENKEINVQMEIDKLNASFLWICEVREVKFYGLGGVSVKTVELPIFRVVGYDFMIPYQSPIRVIVKPIHYDSNVKLLKPVNPHLKIHDDLHIDYEY